MVQSSVTHEVPAKEQRPTLVFASMDLGGGDEEEEEGGAQSQWRANDGRIILPLDMVCSTHPEGLCGNGTCVAGVCECAPGYYGATCDSFSCRSNCGSHGSCVGPGACACDAGWTGDICQEAVQTVSNQTLLQGCLIAAAIALVIPLCADIKLSRQGRMPRPARPPRRQELEEYQQRTSAGTPTGRVRRKSRSRTSSGLQEDGVDEDEEYDSSVFESDRSSAITEGMHSPVIAAVKGCQGMARSLSEAGYPVYGRDEALPPPPPHSPPPTPQAMADDPLYVKVSPGGRGRGRGYMQRTSSIGSTDSKPRMSSPLAGPQRQPQRGRFVSDLEQTADHSSEESDGDEAMDMFLPAPPAGSAPPSPAVRALDPLYDGPHLTRAELARTSLEQSLKAAGEKTRKTSSRGSSGDGRADAGVQDLERLGYKKVGGGGTAAARRRRKAKQRSRSDL